MSNAFARALRVAVIAVAAASCQSVMAEQVTIVGPVTKIELAADGASAVATIKDAKSGEEVRINISDEVTLDKFKDKRIQLGDEIRARFEKKAGQNASKSFRKTAGC